MSRPPNLDPRPRMPPDFLMSSASASSMSPWRKALPSRNEYEGMLPAPNACAEGTRQRRPVAGASPRGEGSATAAGEGARGGRTDECEEDGKSPAPAGAARGCHVEVGDGEVGAWSDEVDRGRGERVGRVRGVAGVLRVAWCGARSWLEQEEVQKERRGATGSGRRPSPPRRRRGGAPSHLSSPPRRRVLVPDAVLLHTTHVRSPHRPTAAPAPPKLARSLEPSRRRPAPAARPAQHGLGRLRLLAQQQHGRACQPPSAPEQVSPRALVALVDTTLTLAPLLCTAAPPRRSTH